jgi:hypothetical protein
MSYKLVKNKNFHYLMNMIKNDTDEIKLEKKYPPNDLIKHIRSSGKEITLTYENEFNISFNLNLKYSKMVKEYKVRVKNGYESRLNTEHCIQLSILQLIKFYYNCNDINVICDSSNELKQNNYEEWKKNLKMIELIKKIMKIDDTKANYNNILYCVNDEIKYYKNEKIIEKDIINVNELCCCVSNRCVNVNQNENIKKLENLIDSKRVNVLLEYILFGNEYLINKKNKKNNTLEKFDFAKSIYEIYRGLYEDKKCEEYSYIYHKLKKCAEDEPIYVKSINYFKDYMMFSFPILRNIYVSQFDYYYDCERIKYSLSDYYECLKNDKIKCNTKERKDLMDFNGLYVRVNGKNIYKYKDRGFKYDKYKKNIKKKLDFLNDDFFDDFSDDDVDD